MKQNGEDRIVNRYTYDTCLNGEGLLCKIKNNGHVTKYRYTDKGELASKSTLYSGETEFEVTRYVYNEDGNVKRITYPTGLVVKYRYRDDFTIKKITGSYGPSDDNESFVIVDNVSYDSLNATSRKLTELTFGNGLTTSIQYDGATRLKSMETLQGQKLVQQAIYSRDDKSNISRIEYLDPNESVNYSYDISARLIKERIGLNLSEQSYIAYTYDDAGNRLSRSNGQNSTFYTYAHDANRLDQIGQKILNYDAAGNLVDDRKGKRRFSYDVTNRLTEFYKNDELRATYDYNVQGQRIRKTLQREANSDDTYRTLNYAYDQNGWLLSEYGGNSNKKRMFTRDFVWLNDTPVAQIERKIGANGAVLNSKISYIHTDHLNAPRWATDETGQTVWAWKSDAFGKGKAKRDPDGDGIKTVIRLRFPGQYYDRETSLYYNHFRDYDPNLGRYIQSDPIGLQGGINRYTYVYNNPLLFTDPEGLGVRNCRATSDGVLCEQYDDSPSFQHELAWDYGGGSFEYDFNFNFFGGAGGSLPTLTQCPDGTYVDGSAGACPSTTPTQEESQCTEAEQMLANALRDALNDPRAQSGELGGVLYRLPDGSLGTSNRDSSGNILYREGLTVPIFDAVIPAGATILYGFHTHPDGTGRFFSFPDFILSQPDYARGDLRSGSPEGFLGLSLGDVVDGRLFLLTDAAIPDDYLFSSLTIMELAQEITHCATN